jgi:hypothetical protein
MKRAQPGWLVLALAGIAAAVGSFLPFYTFSGELDLTVWNRSLFPTATLIPVLIFAIGLEALFVLLMGHEPRSLFLNFTWSQARLAGSAFAMVLALAYLVQGRAGASLGTGYIIVSLSTLATFAGAVMTRRAELVREPEEIVEAEHPWRAAVLRWRREMTAKAQDYAAGGSPSAQKLQPISDTPTTRETAEAKKDESAEKKTEKLEEPSPAPSPEPSPETEPTPVPRLSAVQTEPDTDSKSDEKRAPAGRKAAKQAATKTVEQAAGESGDDASAAKDGDAETKADTEAATELETEATAELETADDEREQPAAPG